MNSGIRTVCCLLLVAAIAAFPCPGRADTANHNQDDPVPFIMERARETLVRERAVGFGWNLALGALVGDRPFHAMGSVTFDAAAEVRLFLANTFSIDVQVELGEALVERALYRDWTSFHVATYFHMHVYPHSEGYFSAAPYVAYHAYLSADRTIPAIQIGARAGAEVMNGANTFGMGFYGRPGMRVWRSHEGRVQMACEVVFEMTWTGYILRKVPSR